MVEIPDPLDAPDERIWLPPHERPPNEAAGYLGYYTRKHLPVAFDLVDCDNAWPAWWLYYQAKGRTLRVIEEKPGLQEMHPSQFRAYAVLGTIIGLGVTAGYLGPRSGVYVIYRAERLVAPVFPITLERRQPSVETQEMDREAFDDWLLLAEAE